MSDNTADRLEYLRGQIRAESISYGEIAELQGLAAHIPAGDVELLEWAGVPEHGVTDEAKAEIVRSRAYAIRAHCNTFGSAGQMEEDHNASLPGTLEYDGRTRAFSFETAGRTLRITVEDITLDEE